MDARFNGNSSTVAFLKFGEGSDRIARSKTDGIVKGDNEGNSTNIGDEVIEVGGEGCKDEDGKETEGEYFHRFLGFGGNSGVVVGNTKPNEHGEGE